MPRSAEELVELLDLETIDVNLYRGTQPDTRLQRVFGGQVAAQALVAGVRTVEAPKTVHSLHSYFLRPGDPSVPIVYDVERIRDGRSFSTRRVVARQHGRGIYYMTLSFQVPEEGFEHQDAMPDVPSPADAPDLNELLRKQSDRAAEHWMREWASLELRWVGDSRPGGALPTDERPAQVRLWIRTNGRARRLAADPPGRVHLRQRPDPARLLAGAARRAGRRPGGAVRLARPHHLVPPALPRRRVAALRPGLAVGDRGPVAWPSAGSSPRTAGSSRASPRRA